MGRRTVDNRSSPSGIWDSRLARGKGSPTPHQGSCSTSRVRRAPNYQPNYSSLHRSRVTPVRAGLSQLQARPRPRLRLRQHEPSGSRQHRRSGRYAPEAERLSSTLPPFHGGGMRPRCQAGTEGSPCRGVPFEIGSATTAHHYRYGPPEVGKRGGAKKQRDPSATRPPAATCTVGDDEPQAHPRFTNGEGVILVATQNLTSKRGLGGWIQPPGETSRTGPAS